MALLQVSSLTKHFGGLAAVQKVSFGIARGDIVSLIGPNGAGKTTIFNRLRQVEEEAVELCRWVGLGDKMSAYPRNLTVADQKKIEIARALAVKPKLLLLDEVMSGLTPPETVEAVRLVRALKERGMTIVLIEHVMKVVMGLSDRVIVLHHGEKIAEGRSDQVANDPRVIEAYLGEPLEDSEEPSC
jgi:branched-chain amino acid transport system ATP-binding protein